MLEDILEDIIIKELLKVWEKTNDLTYSELHFIIEKKFFLVNFIFGVPYLHIEIEPKNMAMAKLHSLGFDENNSQFEELLQAELDSSDKYKFKRRIYGYEPESKIVVRKIC